MDMIDNVDQSMHYTHTDLIFGQDDILSSFCHDEASSDGEDI